MNKLVQFINHNLLMLLALATGLSALATYLAIGVDSNTLTIRTEHVYNLLIINGTLLCLIIAMIGIRLRKLWVNLKKGSAGSKLQTRIILLFSLVTIFPTVIVSIFAAAYINIGVQTWFNERIQTAVEESLAVAEAYLSEHKDNLRGDALAMASDINNVVQIALSNPQEFSRFINRQTTLRLLTESVVIHKNRIVAQSQFSFALTFETLSHDIIERMERDEVVITLTPDDKIRAMVKIDAIPETYLIIGRLIDSKVLDHMDNAQGAINDYRSLQSQLSNLRIAFSVIFISLTLLLLMIAIWYGMVFASKLTTPITSLMQMAERVRGGDYSARISTISSDEMGQLSRTFNRMTEQLASQRSELIQANRQLDERRRFSEAVLSGVSAGIIALNAERKITLVNRPSSSILGKIDLTISTDHKIDEVLPGIQELLAQADSLKGDVAQDSITLTNNDKNLTLHLRVTAEHKEDTLEGYIVTFDDITLLVTAQRNAAWADVARRVAHEIKNPLTPIQLAAERLKKKYLKFLGEEEHEGYLRYVDTISKNVDDIRGMVEEFVSFARMPTARIMKEDLASLVRKSTFSSQVAFPEIDIKLNTPQNPVMMECDERQISQVMTNLIKNAAESIESRTSKTDKGQINVGLSCENDYITLVVQDNGSGFPSEDANAMLEPYITTRSKGSGLGLTIVKKIVDDHKGSIKLENNPDCGAKVTLSFPQHCDI